jgi:hypothetical protein
MNCLPDEEMQLSPPVSNGHPSLQIENFDQSDNIFHRIWERSKSFLSTDHKSPNKNNPLQKCQNFYNDGVD